MGAGCERCWAERIAGRHAERGQTYYGIAKLVDDQPRWTGKVQIVQNHFLDPLQWDGRVVLAGTMTDFFYPKVTEATRDRIFGIMALCGQHVFQVTTKYVVEMRQYFVNGNVWKRIEEQARVVYQEFNGEPYRSSKHLIGPMQHLWLGISAENQPTLEARWKMLEQTPAALRFITLEPLLSEVALGPILKSATPPGWVIVGGESGEEARPMARVWVRRVRDVCVEHSVPFWLHQWGAWVPASEDLAEHKGFKRHTWPDRTVSVELPYSHSKAMMQTGALLDGIVWRQRPETGIGGKK